jgi:hypothetical protein
MTIDEMIAVLQAAKDGKPIQFADKCNPSHWCNDSKPDWDFTSCNFRVKPPEPPECWLNIWLTDGSLGSSWLTEPEARHAANTRQRTVHMREVIE